MNDWSLIKGYRSDRGWSWFLIRKAILRHPARYCYWLWVNRHQTIRRKLYVCAVSSYCDQERIAAGLPRIAVCAGILSNLTD